jgi:hypothetical protein
MLFRGERGLDKATANGPRTLLFSTTTFAGNIDIGPFETLLLSALGNL